MLLINSTLLLLQQLRTLLLLRYVGSSCSSCSSSVLRTAAWILQLLMLASHEVAAWLHDCICSCALLLRSLEVRL